MTPNLLNADEYQATFGTSMKNVTDTAANVLDIWPYVRMIPHSDLAGHELSDGHVECVYRAQDNRFDHVLVITNTKNVFLAVIVDLTRDQIHGHHLLDLNEKYGLT